MKKVISIVLALVMALSCMALAFAEDTTNVNINGEGYKCADCGKIFTDAEAYNAHLDEEAAAAAEAAKNTPFFDLTASGIVERLLHIFQTNAGWWDAIEDIIIRLVDLVESALTGGAAQADVAGAISDLEAKVASLPIVGDILTTIHNLINTLKQKIKDLYAGNKETEAVESTDAAPTADTGSSSMGIAAFAAVSVAAAAAYVCTKKKAA